MAAPLGAGAPLAAKSASLSAFMASKVACASSDARSSAADTRRWSPLRTALGKLVKKSGACALIRATSSAWVSFTSCVSCAVLARLSAFLPLEQLGELRPHVPSPNIIVKQGADHYATRVAQSALFLRNISPPPPASRPLTMRILILSVLAVLALASAEAPASPATTADRQRCHPSYPDYCIPPPPPDLDCPDITGPKPFRVRHDVRDADPHGFDRDRDGRACEPRPQRRRG